VVNLTGFSIKDGIPFSFAEKNTLAVFASVCKCALISTVTRAKRKSVSDERALSEWSAATFTRQVLSVKRNDLTCYPKERTRWLVQRISALFQNFELPKIFR
jgi:hypothetical protein